MVGAEHAPNLVAWLAGQNIESQPAPADLDAAIRSQGEDVDRCASTRDFGEHWRGRRRR